MYKGKSFLVSVSRKHSQTSEQIADIIYENSPDYSCSSNHRVMAFSLRLASLLVRYLHLDLNVFNFDGEAEIRKIINNKVLYEGKLIFLSVTLTTTNLKF